MTTRSTPVRAANRHGQVQCLLLIVGLVIVGFGIVFEPDLTDGESGESVSDRLAPFVLPVVGLVILWALVLVVLLRRHAEAIRTDPGARRAFRDASVATMIVPVLPGLLIWGWPGWIAGAIGLCCLVAVLTLLRGRSG